MTIKNKRKHSYKNRFKFLEGEIWVNSVGEQFIVRNGLLTLITNKANSIGKTLYKPNPKDYIKLATAYDNKE